jgi:hypothetical protein
MILGRHSFVAFIVLAAIVSVFFSPLMPATGLTGRHYTRTDLAAAISPAAVLSTFASHFVTSIPPQARAIHSEMLIALNCARLC